MYYASRLNKAQDNFDIFQSFLNRGIIIFNVTLIFLLCVIQLSYSCNFHIVLEIKVYKEMFDKRAKIRYAKKRNLKEE